MAASTFMGFDVRTPINIRPQYSNRAIFDTEDLEQKEYRGTAHRWKISFVIADPMAKGALGAAVAGLLDRYGYSVPLTLEVTQFPGLTMPSNITGTGNAGSDRINVTGTEIGDIRVGMFFRPQGHTDVYRVERIQGQDMRVKPKLYRALAGISLNFDDPMEFRVKIHKDTEDEVTINTGVSVSKSLHFVTTRE